MMRRFVLKFLLAGAILNSLFYCLVQFTPEYLFHGEFAYWQEQKRVLDIQSPKKNANKIILGDSRVSSAVKSCNIPSTYNLALTGSSTITNYYSLKRYLLKHSSEVDTVILSYAPFLLNAGSDEERYYEHSAKFKMYSWQEILEIDSALNFCNDTSLGGQFLLKNMLYRMNWVYFYQANARRWSLNRAVNNEALQEKFIDSCGSTCYDHIGIDEIYDTMRLESTISDFECAPIKEHYLKKALNLCKLHQIHVIYTTVPLNKFNYKYCTPSFKQNFCSYLEKLAQEYPDFDIETELPWYEISFFGDYSHLSTIGAMKFTEELKKKYFEERKK